MKDKIITFGEIMLRLSPVEEKAEVNDLLNVMLLKQFTVAVKPILPYHLLTLALTVDM